ncbi:MAG: ribose 5-phosphate isomerase B [Actinomycetota bacterium]
MARRDLPTEEAVRALVTRVVDAVAVAPTATAERSEASPLPTDGAIAIGADHGGFRLKERLGFRLREAGRRVVDCGTDSTEAVDYPDFALAVAEKVASGECSEGIVVDGAGIGSAMVANKVPGVRAASCYDISSARNSREHNHANVLTLGAGLIGEALAWQIVEEWLATPWAGGRHAKRVEKIDAVDRRYARLGEAV